MDFFPPMIHGTLREHYLLLFAAAGGIAMTAGFIGAWIGARLAASAALRQVEASRPESVDAREIRELAISVEAIGLEVERIAEAQRFVAKVLVERRDALAAPPVRRDHGSITPH